MDPFKSTIFYPQPKVEDDSKNAQKPTPMNQCIMSGLPVFARDTGKDAKKAYMGCGYEHFCFNYYAKANDRTRHTYELLQMDKPTKIYLDFDHDNVADKEDFVKSSNEFIKAVIANLNSKDGDVSFYVLEASTDKKLSRHVIFECFLADIPSVKMFVDFVADTKCACKYLDRRVYTRNRLFRLIYSYKFGKDPSSALTVNSGDNNQTYNPFHVFKTMIQAKIPPHYVGPFDVIKSELAQNVTFLNIKGSRDSGSNGYGGSALSSVGVGLSHRDIGDFIANFNEGAVLLGCKENDDFITGIVGGKQCPWIQRVHKNNNQYLTICKKTMRGFFQCADMECADKQHGLVPYGHMDMSFLWRQSLLSYALTNLYNNSH